MEFVEDITAMSKVSTAWFFLMMFQMWFQLSRLWIVQQHLSPTNDGIHVWYFRVMKTNLFGAELHQLVYPKKSWPELHVGSEFPPATRQVHSIPHSSHQPTRRQKHCCSCRIPSFRILLTGMDRPIYQKSHSKYDFDSRNCWQLSRPLDEKKH